LLTEVLDKPDGYESQQAAADRALIHELGLDRFCVYTASTDPPPQFRPPKELVAAKPDRMALSVSGSDSLSASALQALDQKVGSILADEFKSQTGRVPLPLVGPPNVRITFVDSLPDEETLSAIPPSGSQHGYTLAHLAQQLVCHDGRCAATIASRRTLNRDQNQLSPALPDDRGGHIGEISELAEVITKEVWDWLRSGNPRHLILNLSIGWDGENKLDGLRTDLDARELSELEPSVQAVYGALQFAVRKGVLVIAAAGNRRGGSLNDSNWPLLPAAWELQRPSRLPADSKLVYAVGGVDWQGLPLPNSRTRGLPERVAYGDHAAAEVARPDLGPGMTSLTAVYTGTSVATAVVSSVAAVIWHLRPELRPAEVMEIIDRSSVPQEARADFYAGRDTSPLSMPPPLIRQVSLCAAVKQACAPDGRRCSTTLAVAPECKLYRQPPPLFPILLGIEMPSAAPFQITNPPPIPPCHPSMRLLTSDGRVPLAACPTDKYYSISCQRWVLPQPGDDPCPKCSLFPPPPITNASLHGPSVSASISYTPSGKQFYALAIPISPDWSATFENGGIESASLDIDRFANGVLVNRMTYPIKIEDLKTKVKTKELLMVPGLGDGESLRGCRAQLNFVVVTPEGKMSIQSPVMVDP
jgi:hypothetical protein